MRKKILFILMLIGLLTLCGCSILSSTTLNTTTNSDNSESLTDSTNKTTKEIITTTSEDPLFPVTTSKEKEDDKDYSNIPIISKNENKADLSKVGFFTINDTHGQFYDDGDYMGLENVDAIFDYVESENGFEYIRIAAGDLFQGSYVSRMTWGRCMVDALNAMNLDIMILGNHEFDWTLDRVHAFWDNDLSNGEANFPLLCCNLVDSATGTRPDWVAPYAVIEYSDIKVGVIGAIGENQESDIDEDSIQTYYFDRLSDYVKTYTVELRDHFKCDVVVLAVHDYNNSYENYATYKYDYRLDAMIFGHTHQSVDGTYRRTVDNYEISYIQCYTKNGNVGSIVLNLDNSNKPVNGTVNHYNKGYFNYYCKNASTDVLNVINEYQDVIDSGKEVIYIKGDNELDSKEECGEIGVRAMLDYFDADLGCVNSGGVRTTLSNNNVTVADVFEIFPFDNKVVVLNMTGSEFYRYINSYGTAYAFRSEKLTNYNKDMVYKVVIIDYMAKKNNWYIKDYTVDNTYDYTDVIMRDLLVEYLRSLD